MPITTSERNAYIGAHVRPSVKKLLRAEADRRGISVSEFISDACEQKLGVHIPQEDSTPVAVAAE